MCVLAKHKHVDRLHCWLLNVILHGWFDGYNQIKMDHLDTERLHITLIGNFHYTVMLFIQKMLAPPTNMS